MDLKVFRKARVIGEVTRADGHIPEAASSDDDVDEGTGNEDVDPGDQSAVALVFIAKARESAEVLVAKPRLALSGVTTLAASQISFGKSAQHWLTPAITIETSKCIVAKSKASKTDFESNLEEYSGKSSTKKFCSLGIAIREPTSPWTPSSEQWKGTCSGSPLHGTSGCSTRMRCSDRMTGCSHTSVATIWLSSSNANMLKFGIAAAIELMTGWEMFRTGCSFINTTAFRVCTELQYMLRSLSTKCSAAMTAGQITAPPSVRSTLAAATASVASSPSKKKTQTDESRS